MTDAPRSPVSGPRFVLQAEGAAVLAASVVTYAATGGGWVLFAMLFLAPDLFMLGYLGGPRLGAVTYNFGHTYLVSLAVIAAGWAAGTPLLVSVGLIWTAHIGFDRLLGYGLKYPEGFKVTHLSHRV